MSDVSRRGILSASGVFAARPGTMLSGDNNKGSLLSREPGLKTFAPFRVGTCFNTAQFDNPWLVEILTKNFGQITPEWQMKMDYILKPDGALYFDDCDRFVERAEANGLQVHGHTLIWWLQRAEYFARLSGSRSRFEAAYGKYISDVVSRYRGRIRGWDVINECVASKLGYRRCIWSENLSMDYIGLAFQYAKAADANAVLFLNDHHLESSPRKRRQFLILVENLLKRGIPLGGIGCQTHIEISLPPGALRACIRDLSSYALPIHISEFDISVPPSVSITQADLLAKAASLVTEAVEAYRALPAHQQYGFTAWGLRDSDCFENRVLVQGGRTSVFLDDGGRPNGNMKAFMAAVRPRA